MGTLKKSKPKPKTPAQRQKFQNGSDYPAMRTRYPRAMYVELVDVAEATGLTKSALIRLGWTRMKARAEAAGLRIEEYVRQEEEIERMVAEGLAREEAPSAPGGAA